MKSLLKTDDGSLTIFHKGHGQAYHSSAGALLEARSLYIEASCLESVLETSESQISVLDVGLGLGYNALSTIECFMNTPSKCDLLLVSLENEIDIFNKLCANTGEWQENWSKAWTHWCGSLSKTEPQIYRTTIKNTVGSTLTWIVHIDDAHNINLKNYGKFSFIWQDPFSPEMNPSMWSSDWFKKLKNISEDNVKIMSYSVARIVKDACVDAGFQFERIPASGRKRHWLKIFN